MPMDCAFARYKAHFANHGYLSRQWFDIYLDRYEQLITFLIA